METVEIHEKEKGTPFSFLMMLLVSIVSSCESNNQGTMSHSAASNLLVEGNIQPLNIHRLTPSLSWHSNVKSQAAYQIQE